MMFAPALLSISLAGAPTAEDLMVAFTRAFCLKEQDRLAAAEQVVPASFTKMARENAPRGAGAEPAAAPSYVIRNVSWRGRVGNARIWVQVTRRDHRNPHVRAYSTAVFGVSPDTAVDLASFQRRVPITLIPRGDRVIGHPTARIEAGDFVYPAQPQRYGWLQHYDAAAPAANGVEFAARHFHGADYPEQMLDFRCATAPAPRSAEPAAIVPDEEDAELLALSGLEPVAQSSEVLRYTLRRGFGHGSKPTARIVQARMDRRDGIPRILLVELEKEDDVPGSAWRILERREAMMHPERYDKLVNIVAAAGGVVTARSDTLLACSHSDSSRLDVSIPTQRLHLSRGAHCDSDHPAVVAGQLLSAAVERGLELNWTPEP